MAHRQQRLTARLTHVSKRFIIQQKKNIFLEHINTIGKRIDMILHPKETIIAYDYVFCYLKNNNYDIECVTDFKSDY
jgi:hypothetical protein